MTRQPPYKKETHDIILYNTSDSTHLPFESERGEDISQERKSEKKIGKVSNILRGSEKADSQYYTNGK